jgi:hypothetical protein
VSPAVGLHVIANSREAPACMRCRGLTGSRRATDLPIPRLIRALPDRHLANSPYAIPGPPASRIPSGLPPRWPAVQVANEFLLRAPTGTQGLSGNLLKILFYPQLRDCYPPSSPLIHRIPTVFAQPPPPRCQPRGKAVIRGDAGVVRAALRSVASRPRRAWPRAGRWSAPSLGSRGRCCCNKHAPAWSACRPAAGCRS